jgi:DNA-directed RNA polymerase specialized sigma24 family protein
MPSVEPRAFELLSLDQALIELAALDARQARLVELRYFGGLTAAETAEFLEVSPTTVKREWNLAKAWVHRYLSRSALDQD